MGDVNRNADANRMGAILLLTSDFSLFVPFYHPSLHVVYTRQHKRITISLISETHYAAATYF